MRIHRILCATLFAALTCLGAPANACITFKPVDLSRIKKADVVAIGRISNFVYLSDDSYKFDMEIDRVLVGKAPRKIDVTWYSPTMAFSPLSGPHLVALPSPNPPDSPEVTPAIERSRFSIISVCTAPLIFPEDSEEAREALSILQRSRP